MSTTEKSNIHELPVAPRKTRKSLVRRILLTLVPLAVILGGGYMYLTSGRYISTDNAYLKADIISVTPEVSGRIVSVAVKDNQEVKKGDLLFTIDPASFNIAQAQAQANLDAVKTEVAALRAHYQQTVESLKIAQTDLDFQQRHYDRMVASKRAVSPDDVDQAARDLDSAKQKVSLLQQEQAEVLAGLNGNPDTPLEQLPKYMAAQAALDQAKLNLDRTTVHATLDGTAGRAPNVGDYAHAQVPSMDIVDSIHLWIDADYKETDLTQMKPGQPVEIAVDTYPGHKWAGDVQSISPATGSEFSILPAQNASGNWVKVVQRLAVRIAVTPQADGPILRAGMSAEVTTDTGHWPHLPAFLGGGK